MAARTELSTAFEAERPYLVRLAYGTLGSIAEAEDVVQEAWLRLDRLPDAGAIEDLRAWLTRVVGRLALDALRSARRRREHYVGEWLPEPIVEPWSDAVSDRVTLDESVSMALLVVLERLSPAQRAAFALHGDGGGQVVAIRKPLQGHLRVGKALLGIVRRWPPLASRLALVNGAPGLVTRDTP